MKKRRVDSVPEPPPPPPPPAAAAEWPVSAEAKGSGSNQAGPRRAANELDYLIFKHQRIQKLLRKGTNEIKSLATFCKCHADCTRTRSLQKFGGLDAVRIMLKQWLLAPQCTFCCENGKLGKKESHMELPDQEWLPFDEAGLDALTVNVEDLDNPILNEELEVVVE